MSVASIQEDSVLISTFFKQYSGLPLSLGFLEMKIGLILGPSNFTRHISEMRRVKPD
jgi:hypothetical protein